MNITNYWLIDFLLMKYSSLWLTWMSSFLLIVISLIFNTLDVCNLDLKGWLLSNKQYLADIYV